jgi:tetratricopeptide (TPR) repeat protein/peroxiredoxin
MKTVTKCLAFFMIVTTGFLCGEAVCYGQFAPGQSAPGFSLEDLKGKSYDLSQMKDQPMTILYFFDVESRPSQEGLLTLSELAERYKDIDLAVWAITVSSQEKVDDFVTRTKLGFPVLLDRSGVSNLYHAQLILPTVCTLGPGLKMLDYFQGGGKTTEMMLVRLAERELQRKETMIAKAISEEVVKKNPKNVKAETVKGYVALKEGNINEAEKVFKDVSHKGGQGEVLGKEGLVAVYAKKGESKKALELAGEVEQKAPERSYVHVVKGDMLYAQGKQEEAEAAYQAAIKKKEAEPYQQAVRYNQLGRLHANAGKYESARDLYDQAVAIDPYYIEATTNKGVTYEKEGRWDKALESYRQALSRDKNDTFAVVLAKKAQEMLELQSDIERKKRIDRLVKELAARYRSQKETKTKVEDTWTSRPMVLSFVDFQEKGGLTERDGFSTVLTTELADLLNASGRVQVVERVLMERLLEELNLGSSELADPETALRLGKVLAAKLIGTGSLFYLPNASLLNFRLIDTETSGIAKVVTREFAPQAPLTKELYRLNRELLKTIISKYPLQGYIVKAGGDEAIINLGSNQGVVGGTKFEVVEEQEPVKYKGKMLSFAPKPIARIEVVRVEPDLCYARILDQERPIKADDKVREKIEEAASGESDVM